MPDQPPPQQLREWRLWKTARDRGYRIDYGYYLLAKTGSHLRWRALRRWVVPGRSKNEAERLLRQLQMKLAMDPDLQPTPEEKGHDDGASKIHHVPEDPWDVLRRVIPALRQNPLPSIEEMHRKAGTVMPYKKSSGRQWYCVLTDSAYQSLMVMADAAGLSRNHMLEALVLRVKQLAKGGPD